MERLWLKREGFRTILHSKLIQIKAAVIEMKGSGRPWVAGKVNLMSEGVDSDFK